MTHHSVTFTSDCTSHGITQAHLQQNLDRREEKTGEKHILLPKTDCQIVSAVKVLSKGLSFSDVKV